MLGAAVLRRRPPPPSGAPGSSSLTAPYRVKPHQGGGGGVCPTSGGRAPSPDRRRGAEHRVVPVSPDRTESGPLVSPRARGCGDSAPCGTFPGDRAPVVGPLPSRAPSLFRPARMSPDRVPASRTEVPPSPSTVVLLCPRCKQSLELRPLNGRPPRWSSEDVIRAARLIASGKSYRETSALLGISTGRLHHLLATPERMRPSRSVPKVPANPSRRSSSSSSARTSQTASAERSIARDPAFQKSGPAAPVATAEAALACGHPVSSAVRERGSADLRGSERSGLLVCGVCRRIEPPGSGWSTEKFGRG